MKKIFTYSSLCLLAMMTILTTSCKREDLADVITLQDGDKVALSLVDKIEVAGGTNNYTLDNSEMVIPVTIAFDGASTKAFTVQLLGNTDTVATLVANGALPPGTLPFVPGSFSIPPTINIAYGVKSVSFNLQVNRTFLEKNYGADLAFVVKMAGAAKGNTVITGKATTIVVVKTGAIMTPTDVHYITFASPNSVLNLPIPGDKPGFVVGSQDLNVPLDLALSGIAGGLFTVDVARSNEIVEAAIQAGTLTDAVPLRIDQYEVTSGKGVFEAGKNSSRINLAIKTSAVIFAAPNKKLAMGLVLKDPTKFQLGKSNTTMLVTIDPNYYKRTPFNGTPFVIKGTVGVASDFIPASNYDFGGEGVAYHDNGGRDGGQFRRPDQVDIADNNITIGWTGSNEWLSYTVNVEEDGVYEMNAIFGAPDPNFTYSVFSWINNITGGTLVAAKTPGGYGDQQPNLSTVTLKKGQQVIKMYFDNARYDFRGFIFTRKN
ncbi:hypothetical protein [Pedobacter ginsengisoli]|uniref:hypothetical protein n=1 Tax=Pedobacter ginsengisoli TaxID=363852 RepID=UPI00254D1816|nr:hypothetical protein [Pedobacter ginsengisoli]